MKSNLNELLDSSIDNYPIDILYEDAWLLIINKPSGLPTQPTLDPKRPNLYNLLLKSKKWKYIGMHHRLDTPTSGVVLFTKDRSANKGISTLFKEHKIQKNYLCLIDGLPKDDQFEIKNHLKPFKFKNGKTKMKSVTSGGDYAHTYFQVVRRLDKTTLIKASPQTGRMHQIRVHLAENNLPILGDSLYFRADRHYPRLLLHASEIIFNHPIKNDTLKIEAPLPSDFSNLLKGI